MKRLAALCLLVLLSIPAVSQAVPPAGGGARPRVGLALGGGSARGLAHVGVLEWLEENRIPVDYVAGTSMGAIVGGLYAMGYSPAEIRARLREIKWDEMFAGDVPYRFKAFRRKEDRRDFPLRLEFGLKEGVRFPGGLENGHSFGLLIDGTTFAYSNVSSFDELPIPFRTTATDMLRGDPVVLSSGSLPLAIRASMAVPGVFTPVMQDGRLLADGGLLNQVPADIVRQMGAEVVLAVDVGAKPEERTYLDSFAAAVDQSINVMVLARTRQILQSADLVLAPQLKDVAATDWRRSDAIADMGYAAATEKSRFLKTLAMDAADWKAHLEARAGRRRGVPDQIRFIMVEGGGTREQEEIGKRLAAHIGRPLNRAKLESDLTAIAGEGPYESVGYERIQRDGRDGLLVRPKPKTYGPPFVRLLFRTTNARDGAVDVSFGGRLTMFDVGLPNSEFRLDVVVGSEQRYSAEYHLHPVGGVWFVMPRASYDKELRNLFVNGSRVADYTVHRADGSLNVGADIGRSGQLSFGYRVGYLDARVRAGDPLLPSVTGMVGGPQIDWTYNALDSAMIPTRGLSMKAITRYVLDSPGATSKFWQGSLSMSRFRTIGAKNVFFARLAGGFTVDGTPPIANEFALGGPFRLSAYDYDEFRGDHYVYANPGYMRKIGRMPDFIGGNVFLGAAVEAGAAYRRWRDADVKVCATTGFLVESPLGPLYLGGSFGEGGRWRLNFSLGGALIPEQEFR